MGSKSILAVLAAVLATAFWTFLRDTYYAIAAEEALEGVAKSLGMSRPEMIARATPVVLSLGAASVITWAAYRVGQTEKSKDPVLDIDPRVAFRNILRNKRWLQQHTETDREKLQHLVSNYLAVRLDAEIHNLLAQGKLAAQGKKLHNMTDGPLDWIPKEEWHNVEILFSDTRGRSRCIARYRSNEKTAYGGIMLSSRQLAKLFHLWRLSLFK
jgi:hypothetical protein